MWYLRACELLKEAGYQELRCCKSTFVLKDPRSGLPASICCLHVDDGFVVGGPHDPVFLAAKDKINSLFRIKEWIKIQDQETDYLGMRVKQKDDFSITMSMSHYVEKVEEMDIDKKDKVDRLLTEAEVTALRSTVMKLAWPARRVMLRSSTAPPRSRRK